jgi:hypothetical protein
MCLAAIAGDVDRRAFSLSGVGAEIKENSSERTDITPSKHRKHAPASVLQNSMCMRLGVLRLISWCCY